MDITVAEFKKRIGLTEPVIKWLARNQADPLRNKIVNMIDDAIWKGYNDNTLGQLAKMISQVPCYF